MEPTKVLSRNYHTGTHMTSLVVKLYGPVDDERLSRELASIKHRVEQLSVGD